MTAATLTTLACNRRLRTMGDRVETCGRLFDYRGTREQAREAARADGWAATGLSDFCPDHRTPTTNGATMTDRPQPVPAFPTSEQRQDAQDRATDRYFTASEHPDVVELRGRIIDLAREIHLRVPDGPQKAIALTELESVQMRANRGIFAPAIPLEQRR